MTYVMTKRTYKEHSSQGPVSDAQILMYINTMMGLRSGFTKLQVQ